MEVNTGGLWASGIECILGKEQFIEQKPDHVQSPRNSSEGVKETEGIPRAKGGKAFKEKLIVRAWRELVQIS
jgi:hypothetical protein